MTQENLSAVLTAVLQLKVNPISMLAAIRATTDRFSPENAQPLLHLLGRTQDLAEKSKAEKPKAEKSKAEKPKAGKQRAEKPKAEKSKAEKPKAEKLKSDSVSRLSEQPKANLTRPGSFDPRKTPRKVAGLQQPAMNVSETTALPTIVVKKAKKPDSDERKQGVEPALPVLEVPALGLPAPEKKEDAAALGLDQTVSLDALGPVVVNKDGTISRIKNWDTMSEEGHTQSLATLLPHAHFFVFRNMCASDQSQHLHLTNRNIYREKDDVSYDWDAEPDACQRSCSEGYYDRFQVS
jgi:hypothetical protein